MKDMLRPVGWMPGGKVRPRRRRAIVPAWIRALRLMREGEEMVYERGTCYVGDVKFAARTAFFLFRSIFVSVGHIEVAEYYHINERGRLALQRWEEDNGSR